MNSLPRTIAALLACAWVTTAVAANYPYPARVTTEVAEVVSGPSDEFYATMRLPRGAEVEVYREEAGGWCAIRPPRGSFSWVPADAVQVLTGGRQAETIRDDVVTRVGTEFSDAHHVEYITLDPGERLSVLGTRVLPEADATQQREWLKIAPPDGEFRWIRKADLQAPSSAEPVADATLGPLATDATTARTPWRDLDAQLRGDAELRGDADQHRADTLLAAPDRAVQAAAWEQPDPLPPTGPLQPIPAPAGQQLEASQRRPWDNSSTGPNRTSQLVDASQWGSQSATTSPQPAPAASTPPGTSGNSRTAAVVGTIPQRLAELDQRLSEIVAQSVESWDLPSLRQQVARLQQDIGEDPESMQRTRELLGRIAQFQRVHQRYVDLDRNSTQSTAGDMPQSRTQPRIVASNRTGNPPATMAQDPQVRPSSLDIPVPPRVGAASPASTPTAVTAGAVVSNSAGRGFDAEGWLMPVFSSRSDLPEFALTDQQGRIIHFVSADETVNLRRYVRRHIGVYGTRGFLANYQKPHVEATRVVLLPAEGP